MFYPQYMKKTDIDRRVVHRKSKSFTCTRGDSSRQVTRSIVKMYTCRQRSKNITRIKGFPQTGQKFFGLFVKNGLNFKSSLLPLTFLKANADGWNFVVSSRRNALDFKLISIFRREPGAL